MPLHRSLRRTGKPTNVERWLGGVSSVLLPLLLAGCAERARVPTAADPASSQAAEEQEDLSRVCYDYDPEAALSWAERVETIRGIRDAADKYTRWHSPSWHKSHEELAEAIAEAGGEAAIAFKEPTALASRKPEGGAEPVREGTIESGIQKITEMGVQVTHRYTVIPAVAVKMPADAKLVERLQNEPCVDVLNANARGEWAANRAPAARAM